MGFANNINNSYICSECLLFLLDSDCEQGCTDAGADVRRVFESCVYFYYFAPFNFFIFWYFFLR